MGFLIVLKEELSVAFAENINLDLRKHLLRKDNNEDLIFALWWPSQGRRRLTALINEIIYPEEGDRQIHGNASFNQQYFERVCSLALKKGCGIAFLHSHVGPGWQNMSLDDKTAEKRIAGPALSLTELPLVGLTVGTDGIWSARMWQHYRGREYAMQWCQSIRSVGMRLKVDFADLIISRPVYREAFKRTLTVWGKKNHENMARLRVGIVGLGSVGTIVAEILARMGIERFCLIDFDVIKRHNLDRQLYATEDDIGQLKIIIAERLIRKSSTAQNVDVINVPYSIAEKEGYYSALDCDVLFSCVDRPRPRSILNHFAYAHLIPVVDGGIAVRFKSGIFSGVDWQLQTVAPSRPCLECIGAFNQTDVATEMEGNLDDPSYLKGLPKNHRFKNNENVIPFSTNLASLEVLQFIALVTGIADISDFGIQRYRYIPGIVDSDIEKECKSDCMSKSFVAQGDRYFSLHGLDIGAEAARKERINVAPS
jgi:molybdopterin/thiamine biosynthesis adenylyltransferase